MPDEVKIDSDLATTNEKKEYEIKVKVDGKYENEKERDNMIKMLEVAAWKSKKCKSVTYQNVGNCPGSVGPAAFCPAKGTKEDYMICLTGKFWAVQLKSKSFITVQVSSKEDGDAQETCEKMVDTAEQIGSKLGTLRKPPDSMLT